MFIAQEIKDNQIYDTGDSAGPAGSAGSMEETVSRKVGAGGGCLHAQQSRRRALGVSQKIAGALAGRDRGPEILCSPDRF